MKAAEECAKGKHVKSEEDGHEFTTYGVSEIANYARKRQLVLTYFSQYPDIDPDYDATTSFFRFLFAPWYWEWHDKITDILHSLHGGDQQAIDQRRAVIKRALQRSLQDQNEDWLSGLLIHAYGDAYAHTKGPHKSGQEEAYGPWIGHGLRTLGYWITLGVWRGDAFQIVFVDDPDRIKNPVTEPKYLAYVDELYYTLRSDQDRTRSNSQLDQFKEEVRAMTCESGRCPVLQAVPNLDPATAVKEVEAFAVCMLTKARRLTSSEVEQAMSLIKR